MLYLTFTLVVIVFARGAAQNSLEPNMTPHSCHVFDIGNQPFITCSFNFNIKDKRADFQLEYKDTGAKENPITDVALSCFWNGDQADMPKCVGKAGYSLHSISGNVTFEVPSNGIESKSYHCRVNGIAHPPCNATSTTCPPLPSQISPNITPHHTPHHITSAKSTSTTTPFEKGNRETSEESNGNTFPLSHITIIVCLGLVVGGVVFAVVFIQRRCTQRREDEERNPVREESVPLNPPRNPMRDEVPLNSSSENIVRKLLARILLDPPPPYHDTSEVHATPGSSKAHQGFFNEENKTLLRKDETVDTEQAGAVPDARERNHSDSSQLPTSGATATSPQMTMVMTDVLFSFIPKTADDIEEPCISSIVCTQHGTLVMTDSNNKKVKVVEFDSPDTVKASIPLDERPLRLALLADNLVAVKAESKVIYFLRINGSEISLQTQVKTERQYLCICAHSHNKLIVGCEESDGEPASVDIIDHEGHVLRTVIDSNKYTRLCKPGYVCTASNHVYISDRDANVVLKVAVDTGSVVEKLKHTDMSLPNQVFVDKADNIYIASRFNRCVFVRSSNGEWRRLLDASQHSYGGYVMPGGGCVTTNGDVVIAWSQELKDESRKVWKSVLTGHKLK